MKPLHGGSVLKGTEHALMLSYDREKACQRIVKVRSIVCLNVACRKKVGTSRRDVAAPVQRAERMAHDTQTAPHPAPLNAARTAQRQRSVDRSPDRVRDVFNDLALPPARLPRRSPREPTSPEHGRRASRNHRRSPAPGRTAHSQRRPDLVPPPRVATLNASSLAPTSAPRNACGSNSA